MSAKDESGEALLLGCGAVMLLPVVIGWAIVTDGYLVYKLWAWFATPLGAPALTFWAACGVDTLVTALRGSVPAPASDDDLEGAAKVTTPLIRHGGRVVMLLGIGYVLHRWFV